MRIYKYVYDSHATPSSMFVTVPDDTSAFRWSSNCAKKFDSMAAWRVSSWR